MGNLALVGFRNLKRSKWTTGASVSFFFFFFQRLAEARCRQGRLQRASTHMMVRKESLHIDAVESNNTLYPHTNVLGYYGTHC